jgi:hypothetical protein
LSHMYLDKFIFLNNEYVFRIGFKERLIF